MIHEMHTSCAAKLQNIICGATLHLVPSPSVHRLNNGNPVLAFNVSFTLLIIFNVTNSRLFLQVGQIIIVCISDDVIKGITSATRHSFGT